MSTKIKMVTIVCNQGVNRFITGEKYNGLLLDSITDNCIEYENAFIPMYIGYTANKERVFEAINTPMEIQYEAESCKPR